MNDDRILLPELAGLVLVFAGPVYLIASLVQGAVLTRARVATGAIFTSVTLSILAALPLTVVLWWLLGFLPAVVFGWIWTLSRVLPASSSLGAVIILPALLGSLIAFGLVGRFALLYARSRP